MASRRAIRAVLLLAMLAPVASFADAACPIHAGSQESDADSVKAAVSAIRALEPLCPKPVPDSAFSTCADDDKVALCRSKAMNALAPAEDATVDRTKEQARDAQLERTRQLLRSIVTTPSVPGLVGSVTDFVNAGQLSALPIVRNLDDPYTLGAVYIPFKYERGWFVFRVGVFFNPSPQINPVLKQRLIDTGRTAQLAALDHTYGIEDDFSWQAELSLRSAYLGRDFDEAGPTASGLAAAMVEMDTTREVDVDGRKGRCGIDAIDAEARLLRKERWTEVRDAVECVVSAHRQYGEAAAKASEAHRLDQFAKLQHNQPDIVIRYRQLQRKAVVEANAWNVNVTATSGLLNTNWLRMHSDCGGTLSDVPCVTYYEDALDSALLDLSPSLSVYGEFGRITDLTIPLDSTLPVDLGPLLPPIPGLPADTLTIEGGKYWRYGGALGAMLEPVHEKNGVIYSTRVDFAYDAWKLANNAQRLDYDVLRLTLTRRIGAVSLVVNLMRRDRAKFRDANVAPNGVTAGLGYSFFSF